MPITVVADLKTFKSNPWRVGRCGYLKARVCLEVCFLANLRAMLRWFRSKWPKARVSFVFWWLNLNSSFQQWRPCLRPASGSTRHTCPEYEAFAQSKLLWHQRSGRISVDAGKPRCEHENVGATWIQVHRTFVLGSILPPRMYPDWDRLSKPEKSDQDIEAASGGRCRERRACVGLAASIFARWTADPAPSSACAKAPLEHGWWQLLVARRRGCEVWQSLLDRGLCSCRILGDLLHVRAGRNFGSVCDPTSI